MKPNRTDGWIAGALRLIVAAVALFSMGTGAASQAQITPHSVPLEFASDHYCVTVNGKPVTVFYAAINLHFGSFDFTGQADVRVTINENDYNRHDFKPLIKPDDFWQGKAVVRPLSRGIAPPKDDFLVVEDGVNQEISSFSLSDASNSPRSIVLIID